MYCYLNGKVIPLKKASIALDDIGLLRGYGVFDFLRTYNARPFLLKEHLARLKHSAQLLNLKLPLSQNRIATIVKELLTKNKVREASIRIVLTGGKALEGVSYNPDKPTFFILIEELHTFPVCIYQKGAKVITHEYQRLIPQAKTLNYIVALKLQGQQKRQGAVEVLYTSNGHVLEGTTSNFFIFKKDTLITAKNDILIGITRNLVIKLAKNKFKIEERDIFIKELKSATEAFLTSTNKEILPIVKIDKKLIGNGKVEENTKYLMDLFHQRTKDN